MKCKPFFFVSALSVLLAGCATNSTIPMKVQSDPLGAYVLMKHRDHGRADSDWIFLGNTPLTTQRRFDSEQLNEDDIVVLRLLKEGYIDQSKEWHGGELRDLRDDHGQLFWNPKLVPAD